MKKTFKNLKKTYGISKSGRKYLFFALICMPIFTAVGVVIPMYNAKQLAYMNNLIYQKLFYVSLIICCIEITRNFINYVIGMSINQYFRYALKDLQNLSLEKILNIKNKSLDEISNGMIINRVTQDCNRLSNIIPSLLRNGLAIITNFTVSFTIFILSKYLFCFLSGAALLRFIFMNFKIKKWYVFSKENSKSGERVTTYISELIRGIRDIKVLNANKNFLNEANDRIDTKNQKEYETQKVIDKYSFITGSISDLCDFMYIILGIALLKANLITVLTFVTVYLYKGKILNMFNNFSALQEQLAEFNLSCERVFEVIDGDTFERETFGKKILKKANGDFEFKNVNFSYKDGIEILKDVSFKVDANSTVAFVGKSGTGKTTIFNLLAKLYEPKSGVISIDGIDIKELTEDSIRGNMTIINQSPYIFNMSIMDNLKIVNPKATKKDIKEACKLACLDEYIESLPEKYDTMVGEGGITLSGGQRQRLAIARALIQKTEIILFDEATSALDNETQEKIQEAINNMKNEYTILIIAHRFSTVINSDKIIFIEDGMIKAQGTHKELLKSCKGYKELYELELKK